MKAMKKRKVDRVDNGQTNSNSPSSSLEDLRSMLVPLAKPLLIDLLATLGSQYPFIAEEIASVASADPALRRLFVRGLAWNATRETLYAAFEGHGEIDECVVVTDKKTAISRGYGFITFKDMESAQRALKAPSKMIDGRMVVCNLACEGSSSNNVSNNVTTDQTQRKLYIGDLSPDTTSEMLLNFFRRHGEIEEGSVLYKKDKSLAYGFVTFKTVVGAQKALNDPQRFLGGRIVTVKVAGQNKSKVSHAQVPASTVPVPQPGYPQAQQTPIGFSYPQAVSAYTNSTYASPPAAAPPPYSLQPRFQYPLEKDPQTIPAPAHPGLGGYPYYLSRR